MKSSQNVELFIFLDNTVTRIHELEAENRILAEELYRLKGVEADLIENEERFRQLAETTTDIILIHAYGRIIDVNQAFTELFGYTREEAIGMSVLTLPAPESRDIVIKHLSEGYDKPYEAVGIKKDGTRFITEICSRSIRYKGQNARVEAIRNITLRKKMEEEMLRAQKLDSIGILAGGIAHDFNNLLMAILGNISLAKLYAQSPETHQDHLSRAEKACLRAKDLTHQLLTFSKGGAPIKNVASIGDLLREYSSFALRGSNVRFDIIVQENLWMAEVDECQIGQVISNLVINAVQAMPEGGLITITAENTDLAEGMVTPLPVGRYLKIAFKDQGCGIPREILPKIFDPYFTTKQHGSGLGLASSYAIIKKHDGHITVDSMVGRGTTFCIYLPAKDTDETVGHRSTSGTIPTGNGRILVMDDDEVVLDVATALLASLGYQPDKAVSGERVVELYERAMATGAPYDAVIMDLTVAGGMGGKETMELLRGMDPAVRAIVSSGYANDPIMAKYRSHGFRGVVAKPYDREALARVLHDVLKNSTC